MTADTLSERAWQTRVVDLARLFGLLVFHDHDSRHGEAGFPDLVIVGSEVLFAELKTEHGRVSADQQRWLHRLHNAGARAVIWRPSDWEAVQVVLKGLRDGTVRPPRPETPSPAVRRRAW